MFNGHRIKKNYRQEKKRKEEQIMINFVQFPLTQKNITDFCLFVYFAFKKFHQEFCIWSGIKLVKLKLKNENEKK